jgi:phosphoketolase
MYQHARLLKVTAELTWRRRIASLNYVLASYVWQQDVINCLPQLGASGAAVKKLVQDKLVEHKQYIDTYGQGMPEIQHWKWGNPKAMLRTQKGN